MAEGVATDGFSSEASQLCGSAYGFLEAAFVDVVAALEHVAGAGVQLVTGDYLDITQAEALQQGARLGMGRIAVSVLVFAMLLTACSPSGSTPTPPPNPSGTTMPAQTATPVSLDPCLFINSQEASSLAGASFGDGIESTTSNGAKMCTYGSQTTNVFIVEVGQASTPEAAQAFKASFLADIEANLQEAASHGLTVTEQPDFADGGVMFQAAITGGGQGEAR